MSSLPRPVQRYLDKLAVKGPWRLDGVVPSRLSGAVVIPALAEGDSLFASLRSLAAVPADDWQDFLVVVVINHRLGADSEAVLQNRADLARLRQAGASISLPLAWVDAASPGLELPPRRAGVGFARKLGMDLVLPCLNWQAEPLLVCLDADTLVEPGYLQAVRQHFRQSKAGAAVLPFRHQPAADRSAQLAIDRYELFLRSYVFALRLAGSPYAFDTVGSTMSCRAMAYVRCGGMSQRQAGEDFYFMQKLAKTDGVEPLYGTTVFPSARVSERTPFGTGRSVARLLAGDQDAVLFYPVAPFRILNKWLRAVEQGVSATAESLLAQAEAIDPVLGDYLLQADWLLAWPRLQEHQRSDAARLRAFHVWFDGLKTLRLIHRLCDSGYARGEAAELLPELFAWAGHKSPATVAEMLEFIRVDKYAMGQ